MSQIEKNVKYWRETFKERSENFAGIRLSEKDCKELYEIISQKQNSSSDVYTKSDSEVKKDV